MAEFIKGVAVVSSETYGVVYGLMHNGVIKYVGQTTASVNNRLLQHFGQAERGKSSKGLAELLSSAPRGDFSMRILEECDSQESLDASERKWIAETPGLLNVTSGGRNGISFPAGFRQKETCVLGHPIEPGAPGDHRRCKTCRREYEKARGARRSEQRTKKRDLPGYRNHRIIMSAEAEMGVVELLKSGRSRSSIAKETGIPVHQVQRAAHRAGFYGKPAPRIDEENIESARLQYLSGEYKSLTEIATIHGISRTHLGRLVKKWVASV